MIHPYFNLTGDEARGLLYGLLEVDKIQLKANPSMPSIRKLIQEGSIRYERSDPQEHWQSYRELVEQVQQGGVGYGDCEDFAPAIAAEDQVRRGLKSIPVAYTPKEGLFHVVTAVPTSGASYGVTRFPDALGAPRMSGYVLEDPSAAAGMETFGSTGVRGKSVGEARERFGGMREFREFYGIKDGSSKYTPSRILVESAMGLAAIEAEDFGRAEELARKVSSMLRDIRKRMPGYDIDPDTQELLEWYADLSRGEDTGYEVEFPEDSGFGAMDRGGETLRVDAEYRDRLRRLGGQGTWSTPVVSMYFRVRRTVRIGQGCLIPSSLLDFPVRSVKPAPSSIEEFAGCYGSLSLFGDPLRDIEELDDLELMDEPGVFEED